MTTKGAPKSPKIRKAPAIARPEGPVPPVSAPSVPTIVIIAPAGAAPQMHWSGMAVQDAVLLLDLMHDEAKLALRTPKA